MKFCTRKFKFWQKFRRPSKFLRPGAPQAIPPKYSQNRDFSFFSNFLNLNISHHRLAWEQQKHAFRKVSTGEMHFALRFAIISQKLAPVGSSKDLRKVRKICMEKMGGKFLTFLKSLLEPTGASF